MRWQEIRGKELIYALIGNEVWKEAIDLYLDEVETLNREDDVSITIYNPCNTIFTLMRLAENKGNYLNQ